MKRIWIFACLALMCVSDLTFADVAVFPCPDPSKVIRQDDHWSAEIPAGFTRDGHPIPAISFLGKLEKVPSTKDITFKTQPQIGIIGNNPWFLSCGYDTQEKGNYIYGAGTAMELQGEIKGIDLTKYNCTNTDTDPHATICFSK